MSAVELWLTAAVIAAGLATLLYIVAAIRTPAVVNYATEVARALAVAAVGMIALALALALP